MLPRLFVKVRRKEPAGFVWQQGVDADGCFAEEVIGDDDICYREELLRLPFDFLPLLREACIDGIPVFNGRRRISGASVLVLKADSMDIFSAAKEASKQRDPLYGALFGVDGWRGSPNLGCGFRNSLSRRVFSSLRRLFSCSSDSVRFSVITTMLHLAENQHFLVVLLNSRKHHGGIYREATGVDQGLKRELPFCRRRLQRSRHCASSFTLLFAPVCGGRYPWIFSLTAIREQS